MLGQLLRVGQQVGLEGAFPAAEGGDLIALTTNNSANNKIDIFMERSIDYEADFDPETGAMTATATVTDSNRPRARFTRSTWP